MAETLRAADDGNCELANGGLRFVGDASRLANHGFTSAVDLDDRVDAQPGSDDMLRDLDGGPSTDQGRSSRDARRDAGRAASDTCAHSR